MNKISAAALCLIVMLSFNLNAQTYGLKLIGKVKLPDNVQINNVDGFMNCIDDISGSFYVTMHFDFDYEIIMDRHGNSLIWKEDETKIFTVTNSSKTILENGVPVMTQSESTIREDRHDAWDIRFSSFTTNGYSSIVNIKRTEDEITYKISANQKQETSRSEKIVKRHFIISDHGKNGQTLRSQQLDGHHLNQGDQSKSIGSNYRISHQVRDGYIYFYYITSPNSKYFRNASNLSIKSINGYNLLATVETQSTNKINIQSSENAADWKTIQTISNPSGKQINIPITKPSEFIRAIE